MAHPAPYPPDDNRDTELQSAVSPVEEEEEEPDPNYVHEPCGTKKHLSGAHKTKEFAWCEEAESVVYFTRIED